MKLKNLKQRPFALLGLVLLMMGLVSFVIGGMVEINVTEEEDLRNPEIYPNHWQDYQEKVTREVADTSLFVSWLKGFSQILMFAGIGFILFEIANKMEAI